MNKEIPSGATLERKAQVLQRLSRGKTWLHEIMNRKSKYWDGTFPLPIYLGNGRVPLWISTEIDAFIASSALRRSVVLTDRVSHSADSIDRHAANAFVHVKEAD